MAEERFLTETKHQRFRPYPEYKDSGMKLIGSIPIGWHIKPIFALYERRTQRKHEDLRLLSVYRDYGVILREDREDNFNRPSLDLSPYQLVENRDLVLNKMKTWQGSIAVSELRGIVSPAYIICRPRHGEHDRYMHYLLRAPSYITQYASLSYGVRVDQWDLRFEDFRRIQVLLPPVEDQRAIAAFLDCETGKIDALIAKKERLIELLQEKRTALITQAVTKGLDPNVPMKDSGIEWLGIIPAHWGVKRLKYLSSINDEALSEKTDPRFELIYVDIGSVDQYQGIVEREELVFENAPSRARRIVKDGDVIISTVRTYLRAIAPIKNPDPNLIVSTGFSVIRPSSALEDNFAPYALRASHFVERVVANSVGVSYPAIDANKISCLSVAIPDIKEQQAIVSFLEREMTKIDALVTEIREAIDRLKEYRTALIAAAATGKIDVRSKVTR